MELIYKRSIDVNATEIEQMLKMYTDHILIYLEAFKKRKKRYNIDEYKKDWVQKIATDNTLRIFEYYDNNKLIGFILIKFLEEENYVREFHILKEYRNDGITFKEMIKKAFPYCQEGKEFTGRIWKENSDAIATFRAIGAKRKETKYGISYSKLKEWIDS